MVPSFHYPVSNRNNPYCSGSEDEESSRIHVQSAVDKVVDMVQSVAGYNKPAVESAAGNEYGSAIPQPDSQSSAGVVTPDNAIVNPEPVQSSGSNTGSGCACLNYIRDFCEG